MGNSASSQGSSTGTHDGDVGSSISEEQHDWPIEQAADTPDVHSLQEMRKPYSNAFSMGDCNTPLTSSVDRLYRFVVRTMSLSSLQPLSVKTVQRGRDQSHVTPSSFGS